MSLKIPIICDNNTKQLLIDFSALDLPVIEVTRPADVTENARQVLEARYLVRDAQGQLAETPDECFARVAQAVAKAERNWGGDCERYAQTFADAMSGSLFMPNSPTLMNAGIAQGGMLSACFVLPVEDDLSAIFSSIKDAALVHKEGGGTGFSFSRLRPRGDRVRSTNGVSSGPVSFMRAFDAASEAVKQGGRRRSANMAVLSVDHPDVIEFITAKQAGDLQNFNISLAVSDAFMTAATEGKSYPLVNPRTDAVSKTEDARDVMKLIAHNAWETGDPGVVFIDQINRHNPTPALGAIEATNPCGEVPLLPYEACNLGSINLARMLQFEHGKAAIDWDKLAHIVHLGVRFLDDVITVSDWPHAEIAKMVKGNRKIGLGVFGWHEMLIHLGIPYASDKAIGLASKFMRFIQHEAKVASQELALERGVFPNWEKSVFKQQGLKVRNATVTAIAPTGSISTIAGSSSPSIEPIFALAYRREGVLGGRTLTELCPLIVDFAKERGFYTDEFIAELRSTGSVAHMKCVRDDVKRLFATALEIAPSWHLRHQAAFQESCCNAVSKTINLPENATPEDVMTIYLDAWRLGCKGVTVYRYNSRNQVFNLGVDGSDGPTSDCPRGSCPA